MPQESLDRVDVHAAGPPGRHLRDSPRVETTMTRLSSRDRLVGILAILAALRPSVATGADGQPIAVLNPLSGENPVYRQLSQPLPDVGKPFRGSRFGARITRVTRQPGLRHEYARFEPFNTDQSMTLLLVPSRGEC